MWVATIVNFRKIEEANALAVLKPRLFPTVSQCSNVSRFGYLYPKNRSNTTSWNILTKSRLKTQSLLYVL